MRYTALATDYDGTIAEGGIVPDEVIAACERFRAAGGRAILNTGRHLDDLRRVFPAFAVFDLAILENGAVLYDPGRDESTALAQPPPAPFVRAFESNGIAPVYKGEVLLATAERHKHKVLDLIQQHGLDLHLIFNKGSVMVLPAGVDKALGLMAALEALHVRPEDTIGVGDAENDHAFLRICGRSAAVANALGAVKREANIMLSGNAGAGVIELIEGMLADRWP